LLAMVAPKLFAVFLTTIFVAVMISVEVASQNGLGTWLIGPALMAASALFLFLYVNAIISQSTVRQTLIEELQATQAQLADSERRQGTLMERQRLAREIHDTLAQGFISITMLLEAAKASLTSNRNAAQEQLDQAQQTAKDGLAEARRVVNALRPEVLESQLFPDALSTVAQRWSREAGIGVNTTVTGDVQPFPAEVEDALIRAAQEALTNVKRHASAKRVDVTLSYLNNLIVLDVQDDGVGLDRAHIAEVETDADGGFGLQAMSQRIRELGGTLGIESAPGEGTTIVVQVPISE